MSRGLNWTDARGAGLSRRVWLAGTAGVVLGAIGGRAQGDDQARPDAEVEVEAAVRRLAAKAGLKDVGASRTDHYVAVGDAPEAFREQALELCEKLLESFLKYFKDKGFEVAPPARRMTVVALAGRTSYASYKGEPVGEDEGGHYEVEADQLVIFDARGAGGQPADARAANSRRINTFSLVHEAIHQLTFDAGMLARAADVPVAVSEGLATYGELWQRTKPIIGQFNRLRLQVLGQPGTEWAHVETLLTDDNLFRDGASAQAAYAEAWLLVHLLLKTRPAKFRAYLDVLRTRKDDTRRAADAASAFGDLERLDRELKKSARNQL